MRHCQCLVLISRRFRARGAPGRKVIIRRHGRVAGLNDARAMQPTARFVAGEASPYQEPQEKPDDRIRYMRIMAVISLTQSFPFFPELKGWISFVAEGRISRPLWFYIAKALAVDRPY